MSVLRPAAIEYFDRELRGRLKSVERPGFGVIVFNRHGRDKVKSFSADPDKLRVIPALPAVLMSGVYRGAEAPRPGSGANIRRVHRFEGDVKLGARAVSVEVVVLEDQEGNKFYDHFIKQQAPTNPPAQRRGSGPESGNASATGTASIAPSDRKGNRGGSTQGEPATRQDILSTGEAQPRLPGDVGDVRDREIAHPTLDAPADQFDLVSQLEQRAAQQPMLFGPPQKPKKGPAKTPKADRRGSQRALFESRQQAQGSPTRQLYVPKSATPVTGPQTSGRPISEQEAVNRLREIFAVDRVTPAWLKMVVGAARGFQFGVDLERPGLSEWSARASARAAALGAEAPGLHPSRAGAAIRDVPTP